MVEEKLLSDHFDTVLDANSDKVFNVKELYNQLKETYQIIETYEKFVSILSKDYSDCIEIINKEVFCRISTNKTKDSDIIRIVKYTNNKRIRNRNKKVSIIKNETDVESIILNKKTAVIHDVEYELNNTYFEILSFLIENQLNLKIKYAFNLKNGFKLTNKSSILEQIVSLLDEKKELSKIIDKNYKFLDNEISIYKNNAKRLEKLKNELKHKPVTQTPPVTKVSKKTKKKNKVKKEKQEPKKQKNVVHELKTRIIKRSWDHVFFEDRHVKIKFDKFQSRLTYPFVKSRKSYELLKEHISHKLEDFEIKVHLQGHNIISIEGLDALYNALELNTGKRNYTVLDALEKKPRGKILRDAMRTKSNLQILKIFNIDIQKRKYIRKLSEKQLEEFKIIPVVEKVKLHNNYTEHDSFIFTVKKIGSNHLVNLIWESCLTGKATHIFEASRHRYDDIVNNLETFITAEEGYKRSNLWEANPTLKASLGYKKSLKHISKESLIDWWFKIRDVMRKL